MDVGMANLTAQQQAATRSRTRTPCADAEILEKCDIVTTPGSGFGPAGEGFVRASAFGSRPNILEAVERFQRVYGKK